jgi:hypothetical protein
LIANTLRARRARQNVVDLVVRWPPESTHTHQSASARPSAFDQVRARNSSSAIPRRRRRRVAGDDLVRDAPALLADAPADDLGLEAVVLHVDAGGEQQHAVGQLGLVRLAVLLERLDGDALRLLGPRLAEAQVDELLQAALVAVGVALIHSARARATHPRRIERRDLVAAVRCSRSGFHSPAASIAGRSRSSMRLGAVRAAVVHLVEVDARRPRACRSRPTTRAPGTTPQCGHGTW